MVEVVTAAGIRNRMIDFIETFGWKGGKPDRWDRGHMHKAVDGYFVAASIRCDDLKFHLIKSIILINMRGDAIALFTGVPSPKSQK